MKTHWFIRMGDVYISFALYQKDFLGHSLGPSMVVGPPAKYIADVCGVSRTTARRWMKKAEALGYISIDAHCGTDGKASRMLPRGWDALADLTIMEEKDPSALIEVLEWMLEC